MTRLAAFIAYACVVAPTLAQPPLPKVIDERLKIELIAEHPDINTPIGIDIDERGRLFVIESNTHFPPKDYKGFPTDRIRVFEDTDGDHKPDRITDFHTGETHLMSIRLYHDGSLYAATRKEVFRLRDEDGDGQADERTSLVKLETKGNYPHNGLGGITFDFAGNVYFGFGENLGEPYKLIGADGTTLEGGGEGGNIYSCDKDGRKLRRIATGFWNPFDMTFDAFGRLFAVDNDPDSRPPCRLLHIVEGGDYGFRFKYGRKGLHPFTSWNGEIPGTLPMVAGTGEAPAGILAYESDNLPEDFLGTLLVTSWGDHRIERYALKPRGASFASKTEPIVQGDEEFRPVGIALAPDGSVYFTDWVDKSYPVHGRGRIWRLSPKEEKQVLRPDPTKEAATMLSPHRPTREAAARWWSRPKGADESANSFQWRMRQIENAVMNSWQQPATMATAIMALKRAGWSARESRLLMNVMDTAGPPSHSLRPNRDVYGSTARGLLAVRATAAHILPRDTFSMVSRTPLAQDGWVRGGWYDEDVKTLQELATGNDPFLRQAAIGRLAENPSTAARLDWKTTPTQQLTYVMLSRRSNVQPGKTVLPFLESPNTEVRFAAIQWIAEENLGQYRQNLLDSLSRPDTTPRLFAATLAALDLLDGNKPQAADRVGGRFYLERMVFGDKTAPAARAMALRMLPADNPALKLDALKKLLAVDDARFKLEVVRTLRFSPHEGAQALLMEIAKDETQPETLRAEAVTGLDTSSKETLQFLMDLATGTDATLQLEALRALRGAELNEVQREFLARFAAAHEELAEAIGLVTGKGVSERPSTEDTAAWVNLLKTESAPRADVATPQAAEQARAAMTAAGERVFFSSKAAGCFRCHTVAGRGGVTGPDLSTIGGALSRERIIESILQPSKEIAPRYSSHLIETADGEKLTLMYVGPSPDGKQIWSDTSGKEILLQPADILSKKPLESSIMPADLHKAMTLREMAELVTFLESLKPAQ